MQAKLLRALEAGEVRRIGENDARRVDVRFVAATNADLQAVGGRRRVPQRPVLPPERAPRPPAAAARASGRHRAAARLLPRALRRRGRRHRRQRRRRARRCSPTTIPATSASSNTSIQRAVAVAHGPVVEPADLPEELFARAPADPHSAAADGTVAAARERAEREMIVATLARNHGEVTASARELQVSRTTLWRLMKKHQI